VKFEGGYLLTPHVTNREPSEWRIQHALRQRSNEKSHRIRKQVARQVVRHAFGPGGSKCSKLLCHKVAREGIEPPTRGFSVRCSTN
jgi:hypothetical protein